MMRQEKLCIFTKLLIERFHEKENGVRCFVDFITGATVVTCDCQLPRYVSILLAFPSPSYLFLIPVTACSVLGRLATVSEAEWAF